MDGKATGWMLVVIGLVVALVSLAADALGLGSVPGIIGWKQWLGFALGAAILAYGLWRLRVKARPQA